MPRLFDPKRWMRGFRRQPLVVQLVWAALTIEAVSAALTQNWSLVFIALLTLGLSLLPEFFQSRFDFRMPVAIYAGIVLFIFGTIFLGEASDFYNRYWWWDIALHGGSALGFGLIGFLFVFMMFQGDRYAAPAWAMAVFGFCFALSIGALWEIFEFGMDQIFGLNMQKSGLIDTMWDLIVDTLGASVGAFAGYLYLKGREFGGLTGAIREAVHLNRRFFARRR